MAMTARKPLVSPEDLDGTDLAKTPASTTAKLTAFTSESINAMRSSLLWVKGFLGCPHAYVGREGQDVCPFIRGSVKKKSFWLTAVEGEVSAEAAEGVVKEYLDIFNRLEPVSGEESIYKTLLIVFPTVTSETAPIVIDQLQNRLKPVFVDHGIMIGQFHSNCPEPGVRNSDFRPLQSPVPMLAIRNMVPEDLVFLVQNDTCFRVYIERIGEERVPPRLRDLFIQTRAKFNI